jgi:hypothetical protein
MKKLHVIATSDKRMLAVVCPSDIPKVLRESEIIMGEWFYRTPKELQEFIKENPNILQYFLKGFAYWVEFKVHGFNEHPGRFGKLKRTIQRFSTDLFQRIRALSGRIAEEIKKIIKPKKALYQEQRNQKLIYRIITSKKIGKKFKGALYEMEANEQTD